jgi:alpha-tubulin suppressor-like RCC1 family protein
MKIPDFHVDAPIIDVKCGDYHNMVLTQEGMTEYFTSIIFSILGVIWVWGNGSSGQLGITSCLLFDSF